MFNIGIKILPQQNPAELLLVDNSTGDETVISRTAVLTKTDLTFKTVTVPSGTDGIIVNDYDRDYALNLVYTVTTTQDVYTKELNFVTLGYTNILKKNREFLLEVDNSIQDKQQFKKETLDINYYRMVAKDACRFSNLVGSQKALDYIVDMNLNIDFTLCGCQNI